MEEAIAEIRKAVEVGRTDVLNSVLNSVEGCTKYGNGGVSLKDKILRENVVAEGTFLHLATKLGLKDIVRALLSNGADPTMENSNGDNPYEMINSEQIQQVYVEELLRATAGSNLERMDQLIKAGVDPNSWDCPDRRNSVLHWAVSFANAETVAYLIEKGTDVNTETNEGVTPLHDAVDRAEIDIIRILLKNNASPLLKAERGKFADQSPLDLAAQKPQIFSLLSQHLATQFKGRNRTASLDSIGPESPIYPKDGSFRACSAERNNNCGSEYHSVHSGFNPALEGVIRSLGLKAPIPPIFTDTNLSLLWPQPKNLQQLEGLHFRPDKVLHVSVVKGRESAHRILDVLAVYKQSFDAIGYDVVAQQVQDNYSNSSSYNHSSHIQCSINPDVLPIPNSYRLHISSQKVKIMANDLHGLNYGISTFLQLLTLYSGDKPAGIPPLVINDHPSLQHRAVLIDVSQERIPTIECLFDMIKLFSFLKINYLHLQMRLDKTGNVLPYTKGELVAIDRHCQDVLITLVPAMDIACGISATEYFTYIKPILKDILPCFASSKYVHVGPQLTSLIFLCDNENLGRSIDFDIVWEFIPVSTSDNIVMMCYNALKSQITHSSSLTNVHQNIVLVDYGFQAEYNFGTSVLEISQNGCSSCVCVGTSAWSSLAGCPEASLVNIYHGALNAVSNASLGMIVANWSGQVNFTPKAFAWPGFLLASGLAWNHQTHWEYLQGSLANLLSMYVLKDKTGVAGQVILQLGCTETALLRSASRLSSNDMTNLPPSDGTTLYKLISDPDAVTLDNLSMDALIKCIRAVKKCQTILVMEARSPHEENPVFDELSLTMELMLLACRIGRSLVAAGVNPRSNMGLTVVNLGIANLPPTLRTDIANKLLVLIEEYRRVWELQNYPQGLETSLYKLTTVLQRFIPDSTKILTGRLMSISPKSSIAGHENGYNHDD
ncbi:uncharacterized protein LOC110845233 isoform X2 [Folsomia candida]|uniref:uncharacterized protein LOC110845233 isoform X2 n=1 Tax=Folsomia candida TaxID=158441 RepID=UPI000B8F8EF7|nr:uncharacterized protein LOC110845233 isoform X2 [Folsomia candida]